jgi:NADH-quinone oxidoreductase subunit M
MIDLTGLPLVTLVTFLPLLGAIVIAFTPSARPNVARYSALGFALLAWVVSIALLAAFASGAASSTRWASTACRWSWWS